MKGGEIRLQLTPKNTVMAPAHDTGLSSKLPLTSTVPTGSSLDVETSREEGWFQGRLEFSMTQRATPMLFKGQLCLHLIVSV